MVDRSNEILFEVTENALFVANGGRPFSRRGVISICNSHLSEKRSGGVTDHFKGRDDELIQAIRRTELKTYRGDPNRIRADFNDEQETFQDYGGRLVWELLQNAHDVMGKGNISDVLIGSKGLGFKSVLEITDEPEIHSGDYHFLFSSKRTQQLLKNKKLHDDPPLLTFRIPHECNPTEKTQELLNEGYVTIIRLPFRDEQAQEMTIDRLHNLDAQFLLLTQEMSCVRIRTEEGETIHKMTRHSAGLSNGDIKLSTWGPNGFSQSSLWRRWVRYCSAPTDNEQQLTVAICLPISKQGYVISHDTNIPFHVFYPTDETSGARALIHASLDLEHNRKRVRKGQHDDIIRREFCKLFQDVLKDIPARTALETFGKVACEDGNSPLKSLQKDIWDTLCQTPFVPVIGGDQVRPEDVQLWNGRLGLVLQENTEVVQKACLLESELCDLNNLLRELGSQPIKDEDYIRLLRYCRNDSLKECFASWRVLIKDGQRILSRDSRNHEDREDLLERLRAVPCWWTGKEVAQTLNGSLPMTLVLPEDWPDWLPADSLHPRMRKVIERYETKAKKGDNGETLEIWRDLISGWILKQREEYLYDVLLPFVSKWYSGQWKTNGWRALLQVLSWSPSRKFAEVPPLLENPNGTQREKQRAKMAKALCLPTDKGWLPAADCYAGEDWGGPPVFDRFFASVRDRGLVLPFHRWPNQIRKGTKKDQWKALLRWVGVSWEPKVRYIGDLPDHYLAKNYQKDSEYPYKWIYDWQIEFFPECIHKTNNDVDSASIIRTLLPLVEAVKKCRAAFYSSYYYRKKGEKDYNSQQVNFAYYQIRQEQWLPCKSALFHRCSRVAPHDAFLPGKGLRGLFPEVDKSGFEDEEWFRHIMPRTT